MQEKYSIRKSNRLKGHDYSSSGYYFITICVKDKRELLGQVIECAARVTPYVALTQYGKIVESELTTACEMRKNCVIDKQVIMPNHIHLILVVKNFVGADCNQPATQTFAKEAGRLQSSPTYGIMSQNRRCGYETNIGDYGGRHGQPIRRLEANCARRAA